MVFTTLRREVMLRPNLPGVPAGANVKAVQQMLGHASAAMTLDVYAGLFGDDLDAVADRQPMLVRTAHGL